MNIILGDNPFFGVNHRAGSKQMDSEERRFANAAKVVATAQEAGIDTLMLSTHPGYERLLKKISEDSEGTSRLLNVVLVVPFPHTLNTIVAEAGYGGLLKVLDFPQMAKAAADLAVSFVANRKLALTGAFKGLISLESSRARFDHVKISHACLHNVVTDILIGYGRVDILRGFAAACHELGLKPVLISQNPVKLLSADIGNDYTACFSFNPLGYMVNPGLQETESFLKARPAGASPALWAMQIMASGASSLDDLLAFDSLNLFESVLYATQNPGRIHSFVNAFKARFG